MIRARLRLLVAIACLLAAASLPAVAQNSKSYKARLSTVPMDLAMASTVAGSGAVTAVLAGHTLTITGSFDGLRSPATIAQLHKSPIAGVRGPVLFDLKATSGTSGSISGSIELTPAQVSDLDKRRLYVQLHSEKAPDGNLWGWLIPQETRR